MSILRFTDGVEIDTSGEYRTLHLKDGWYVVGHGCSIPCTDEGDAERQRDELKALAEKKTDPRLPGSGRR